VIDQGLVTRCVRSGSRLLSWTIQSLWVSPVLTALSKNRRHPRSGRPATGYSHIVQDHGSSDPWTGCGPTPAPARILQAPPAVGAHERALHRRSDHQSGFRNRIPRLREPPPPPDSPVVIDLGNQRATGSPGLASRALAYSSMLLGLPRAKAVRA